MLFARLTLDDLSPMTPPSNDGFYFPFPVAQKKTRLVDENSSDLNSATVKRLTSSQLQHISQEESDFENKFQSLDFSQECKKYISAVDDGELMVVILVICVCFILEGIRTFEFHLNRIVFSIRL